MHRVFEKGRLGSLLHRTRGNKKGGQLRLPAGEGSAARRQGLFEFFGHYRELQSSFGE